MVGLYLGVFEELIKRSVMESKETDGVNPIKYLSNLNGVIDLNGYTDILSAVVGADGLLSVLVSNADDSKQSFVSLWDLPLSAVMEIFNQLVKVGTEFAE